MPEPATVSGVRARAIRCDACLRDLVEREGLFALRTRAVSATASGARQRPGYVTLAR